MAILKFRDADGKVREILAIKGDKGDKGEPGEVIHTDASSEVLEQVFVKKEDVGDNTVIAYGQVAIDGVAWHYRKWANGFAECWGAFSKEGTVLATGASSDAVRLTLALPISYNDTLASEKRPMAFVSLEAPTDGYDTHWLESTEMGPENVNITVKNPSGIATIEGTIYTVSCWK